MTKYDLYKSITLFLLYQVPENTSASDVEIYIAPIHTMANRWMM